MPFFPPENDIETIFINKDASDEALSAFAPYSFQLEELIWPTLEHYHQAMQFENEQYREKIRLCTDPKKAAKLGRTKFRRRRKNWKNLREIYMTRGVYTQCKTYPDIQEQLLNTGDKKIICNTQYDYFWGCGRDRRGHNTYGQVLMNVRKKLNEEKNGATQ